MMTLESVGSTFVDLVRGVDMLIRSARGVGRGMLVPDDSLKPVLGQQGGWRSHGERACFTYCAQDPGDIVPAGWYRFSMNLCRGSDFLPSPCLYPTYVVGAIGDAKIVLSRPDFEGRVDTLILFKHAVDTLRFCPAQGSKEFSMSDIRLESVSRAEALRRMIEMPPRGSRGWVRRLTVFAKAVAETGVSAATDSLYRNYCGRLARGDSDNYGDWCELFDTLDADRMRSLEDYKYVNDTNSPLVSILLPIYQTPENLLRQCIDSVLAQVYSKWELCIADDASLVPHVAKVLAEYAALDSRIKVVHREHNGHISEASNTALSLASGQYVALLDHDDELRPHALLEFIKVHASMPALRLCYSDEDKIDLHARRFDPYFKPDFDIDLLRGQNYLCHFTVVATDLVREVGGFRKGYEGSQDHDLFLRCVERLHADQIAHAPKILYHWRAVPGSTALSRDAKDYASSAGARAVADHLQRTGTGAHVEELSHGHYRVHWPLPTVPPKVSIVIPTRDKVDLLRQCVSSILDRTTYPYIEILVIDNGSAERMTLDYLRDISQDARIKVLRDDSPFNFSRLNNEAVRQAGGDVIVLLNNDIEIITPDWLEEMVSQALRPDVGAVGAMLYYPNDTIQHAGVILGIHGVAAHIYSGMPRGYPGHGGRARVAHSLSAVTGACLVVRREVYQQVGGLDESLAVAFNDIDFCLRVHEAGYRNIWTPFAELYHHESASRGVEDTPEKQERFQSEVATMMNRWGLLLKSDPAYNPNLSLNSLTCELSFPPRVG